MPPWSRCKRAAAVDPAHGASIKSVATGRWPCPASRSTRVVPGHAPVSHGPGHASSDHLRPVFVTAGLDGVTRVWRHAEVRGSNPDGGGQLQLRCVAALEGHAAGVRAVACHPATTLGGVFGSAPSGAPGGVEGAEEGADVGRPGGQAGKGPDGWRSEGSADVREMPPALVATTSYDRTVRLWHGVRDRPPFPPLEGHSDYVLAAAFSVDGALLATGSADGQVRVWRARVDVRGDGDGGRGEGGAGTGADSGAVRRGGGVRSGGHLRDAGTGAPGARRGSAAAPVASFHAGGGAVRCVAMADWSTWSDQIAPGTRGPISSLTVTGGEDGQVRVWSNRRGDVEDDAGDADRLASSASAELILTGHGGPITGLATCPSRAIDSRAAEDASSAAHESSRSTALLVAGCDDGAYGLWEVGAVTDGGREERGGDGDEVVATPAGRCRAHVGSIRACLFIGTDAGVMASSSEDRTVRLWDLQRGACLCVLVGPAAAVECVAFSSCGLYLASGLADGRLWVWRDGRGGVEEEEEEEEEEEDAAAAAATVRARLAVGMRLVLQPPVRPPPGAQKSARSPLMTSPFDPRRPSTGLFRLTDDASWNTARRERPERRLFHTICRTRTPRRCP